MSKHSETHLYFENNACIYSECIFCHKGYCCCRIDEMYYNSDNTCGRYIKCGDLEVPTVLEELIGPGTKLPARLLFNRKEGHNDRYETINSVEFYPNYVLIKFGDHNIKTTIYNDDILHHLIREREDFAVTPRKRPFYCV